MFSCRINIAFLVRFVLVKIRRPVLDRLVTTVAGRGTDSHPRHAGRFGTMGLGHTDCAMLVVTSLP